MSKRSLRRRAKDAKPSPAHHDLPELVPHPRYGDAIVPSSEAPSERVVRDSFWRYPRDTIFPETAIRADITRQNFTTFPRVYYVDTLRTCRACHQAFIFFAREQRYWYEVLRFYVDADCVQCPGCRRGDRQLRSRFQRYSGSVGRADLEDRELVTLVGDAVFLWHAGILRDEQQLRRLRNLARRRVPNSSATAHIDEVIAALEKKKIDEAG